VTRDSVEGTEPIARPELPIRSELNGRLIGDRPVSFSVVKSKVVAGWFPAADAFRSAREEDSCGKS
jgi:hypothetical protein